MLSFFLVAIAIEPHDHESHWLCCGECGTSNDFKRANRQRTLHLNSQDKDD